MKIHMRVDDEPTMQDIPAILGKRLSLFGWDFVWWGLGQAHKWRWGRDHIDLGPVSVYGFRENQWFWRLVALFVKPLRWNYHRRFGHPIHKKTPKA